MDTSTCPLPVRRDWETSLGPDTHNQATMKSKKLFAEFGTPAYGSDAVHVRLCQKAACRRQSVLDHNYGI